MGVPTRLTNPGVLDLFGQVLRYGRLVLGRFVYAEPDWDAYSYRLTGGQRREPTNSTTPLIPKLFYLDEVKFPHQLLSVGKSTFGNTDGASRHIVLLPYIPSRTPSNGSSTPHSARGLLPSRVGRFSLRPLPGRSSD